MGYMNEFPHSRMFDSDLREILEFFNSLTGLPEEVAKLRKYITDLDLQDEVNKKIDELITEGKFNEILTTLFDTVGFVTPEMFGAKGDGVTDDTIALQKAINQCDILFIPKGVYCFTELELKDNLTIVGNGTLLYIGTPTEFKGYYLIHTNIVDGNKNITIVGITFDGNEKNKIYDDTIFGCCDILTLLGENIRVYNCNFINATDSAILLSCCKDIEISGCYFDYANDSGIYVNANGIDDGMKCFNIHDNIFKNTKCAAIACKRITSYGIINNNIICDCSGGITFENASTQTDFSKQCDVTNNYLKNIDNYGILIRGGYSQNVNSNRIEECSNPIIIESAKNVNCNNNMIYGCKEKKDGLIWVSICNEEYPTENINIVGNNISGDNYGILFYTLTQGANFNNIIIANNNFNTELSAIKIIDGYSISNMIISNNIADKFELCNDNVSEILVKDNIINTLQRNVVTLIDRVISYGNITKRTYISNQRALANNYFFKRYDTLILTDNYGGDVMLIANNDGLGSEVLVPCITLN